MLDIVDALDLLNSGGHRPAPRLPRNEGDRSGPPLTVADLSAHVTDIVAGFLHQATLPGRRCRTPITGMSTPAPRTPTQRWTEEPLTLGATIVLCAAESARRRGATWHQYVRAAEHAADRYLTLLPDSAFHSDPLTTPSTTPRPQPSPRTRSHTSGATGPPPGPQHRRALGAPRWPPGTATCSPSRRLR